jgi:hypothetical protein
LSLLRRLSASGSKILEVTAVTQGVRRLGAFSQRNERVEEKRIDTPLPPADPVSAPEGVAADDDSDDGPSALATLANKRGPGAWPDKSNIYALSDEQVKEWVAQHKLQPYRARQLRQWVYGSRISSWENFRGFPKEESALLAQQVCKSSTTLTQSRAVRMLCGLFIGFFVKLSPRAVLAALAQQPSQAKQVKVASISTPLSEKGCLVGPFQERGRGWLSQLFLLLSVDFFHSFPPLPPPPPALHYRSSRLGERFAW